MTDDSTPPPPPKQRSAPLPPPKQRPEQHVNSARLPRGVDPEQVAQLRRRMERDAYVRRLYAAGWRTHDICNHTGMGITAVYGALHRPPFGISKVRWEALREMAAEGDAEAAALMEIVKVVRILKERER
jgi:hypothetical protein